MKNSIKKLTSIALSAMMVIGSTALPASAAVAGEPAADGETKVYFQYPTDGSWGDVSSVANYNTVGAGTNVFCTIYAISGNSTSLKSAAWQTSLYACKAEGNGVFSYDTTALGTIEDNADYGILFSFGSYQTCDILMTSECLGDTLVIDDGAPTRENAGDSSKRDYLGHWVGHPAYSSLKKITSLNAIIDGVYPPYQDRGEPMAYCLRDYLNNSINISAFTLSKNLATIEAYGTTPLAVYNAYMNLYADKLQEASWTEPNTDDPNAPDSEYSIALYTHQDGVDDLEADGVTLKDLYRKYVMTSNVYAWNKKRNEYKATATTTSFPTRDYVMDRLGLTEEDVNPTTAAPTTEEPTTEEPTEAEPEVTYIIAGNSAELFGTVWDTANLDNIMTKDGSVYKRTVTVPSAMTEIQVKAVKTAEGENEAVYYGDATGNNITFNMTAAGTFTVIFDPATELVTVEGANVQIVTELTINDGIYAAGNGEGDWLWGANWVPDFEDNLMEEVADGVWETEYWEIPAAFGRQVKFAVDGAWTHNFGGVFEGSGIATAADYNGANIAFDTTYESSTIKLQLDLRNFDYATKEGATFTITLIDENEEPTEEPTTEEPTTIEPTTIAPTTVAPTTIAPTTVAPTTIAPTTVQPTTVAPTTVAPTTVQPTTVQPTTVQPTTVQPTTVQPTTVEPTTEAPTDPAPSDVYLVMGNDTSLFVTEWDSGNLDNQMTYSNGVYSRTYTVTGPKKDISLKVVKASDEEPEYFGNSKGNNIIFDMTAAGTFTVTFDPNQTDDPKVATVTGDYVKFNTSLTYDCVYAVGNGDGDWLWGASWVTDYEDNLMEEVATDVWEIEYTEIPFGFNRQVKFAIDGSWTYNFGGVFEGSGVVTPALFTGNPPNIAFDTLYQSQTIKIQLDLRNFDFTTTEGATFTITLIDEGGEETSTEPTTTEPVSDPTNPPVPVDGFTVNATSNLFGDAAKTFTTFSNDGYVTVNYLINAQGKSVVDFELDALTYDPTVLEWNSSYNQNFFAAAVEAGLGNGVTHLTEAGRVTGNFASVDPALAASGAEDVVLVSANFRVIDASKGATTVNLIVENFALCDSTLEEPDPQYKVVDGQNVNADLAAGLNLSTVINGDGGEELLIGDVNNNGIIDIDDATLIQKYVAEVLVNGQPAIDVTTPAKFNQADVNGDGRISVKDATEIQRFIAEYITKFR